MHLRRNHFIGILGAQTAAFALLPPRVRAASYQFKLGHDEAPSNPMGIGASEFATGVERASGGRISVQVFPQSQLGKDASMIAQTREGSLQFTLQGTSLLSAISPVSAIVTLGFAFKDNRTALAAMDGDLGLICRREVETRGLKVFEKAWGYGFQQVLSAKPITSADDLAGIKIRTAPSPTAVEAFKALGAAPIALDPSETYTALQTHLIDAAAEPWGIIYDQKLYELQKYISITNHLWSSYFMCMNASAWNSLPADLQDIVHKQSNICGARESQNAYVRYEAMGEEVKIRGAQVTLPNTAQFRARLSSYYDRWKRYFGPAAWAALERYSGKLA